MTTFTEYKESLQAREEVAAAVLRHTEQLCKVLEDNFKSRNHGKVSRHDAPVYKFVIETGRKYHKIVMEMPNLNRDPSRSCLLYTSPSPRDRQKSRMPSSA